MRKKEREEQAGGRAGQQAGRFKAKCRLGLGEIEGRDRDTERYREIERHRKKETERQS
jgi:hypothetical protein